MRQGFRVLLGLVLVMLFPVSVLAGSTFGDVAENLMQPTELITKIVMVVCYVVGIALILSAFAQYKIHRQNPKLVPLTTPIVMAVLGIIAMLIPYGSTIFGVTFSAEEEAKKRPRATTTLPLPDSTSNRGAVVPLPGRDKGQTRDTRPEKRPATPPAKPPRKGGSHWTDDPKYN